MTSYFLDTNILARYLVGDNKFQYKKVEGYLRQAKEGKIKLSLISEVLIELEFVFRKVYKLDRDVIGDSLLSVVKMKYINVLERDVLVRAIGIYKQSKVDLVDIVIWLKAKKKSSEVLSFDKDFSKLRKHE